MKRRRASDFGRRPGPFGIRRVDNVTTNDSVVAMIAGNHPVESDQDSSVADTAAGEPHLGPWPVQRSRQSPHQLPTFQHISPDTPDTPVLSGTRIVAQTPHPEFQHFRKTTAQAEPLVTAPPVHYSRRS